MIANEDTLASRALSRWDNEGGACLVMPSHSAATAPASYKCTAIFDDVTLPAGLRQEHRTKQGVWGIIRVLDGRVRYKVLEPVCEKILEPGQPGLILPDQPHLVEPLGSMRMQVEFYNQRPELEKRGT